MDGDKEQVVETGIEVDERIDNLEDGVAALDWNLDEPEEQSTEGVDAAQEQTEEEVPEDVESEDSEGEEDDPEDPIVELSDGTRLKFSELRDGYLRQSDYTKKTQTLAEERKSAQAQQTVLSEQASLLHSAYEQVQTVLSNLLPPEPDFSLLQTDPTRYAQEKALREAAVGELQRLNQVREQTQQQLAQQRENQMTHYVQDEQRKLVEAMPALKDDAKKAEFERSIAAAVKEFGFEEGEVGEVYDHRLLMMAHYARLGKVAESNRSKARKAVAGAVRKGPAPKTNASTRSAASQDQAMSRLRKSGSFEDAMQVDIAI